MQIETKFNETEQKVAKRMLRSEVDLNVYCACICDLTTLNAMSHFKQGKGGGLGL